MYQVENRAPTPLSKVPTASNSAINASWPKSSSSTPFRLAAAHRPASLNARRRIFAHSGMICPVSPAWISATNSSLPISFFPSRISPLFGTRPRARVVVLENSLGT